MADTCAKQNSKPRTQVDMEGKLAYSCESTEDLNNIFIRKKVRKAFILVISRLLQVKVDVIFFFPKLFS